MYRSCTERLGFALRRHLDTIPRDKHKLFARKIDTDPRTLQNYIYGDNDITLRRLLRIIKESKVVRDEVLKMIDEISDNKPE